MSETRLQDEYNKAMRACDIFVSLFFTKTGSSPRKSSILRTASSRNRKPLIYTFFKNAEIQDRQHAGGRLNSL